MKLSSFFVSIPGHPGNVSRTTNICLDRLPEDQGLHLCRPPCKPGSGQYTDGITWKTTAEAGQGFGRVTRGFKTVETGFFESGDRLPQGWRQAAPG